MQYIPIKTRILTPPQDDLKIILDELTLNVSAGDIIVLSSKILAIDEGATLQAASTDKRSLVASEAEILIPRPYWSSPLTVKHSTFIGNAGIDESNGSGHYILLPRQPFASAKKWYEYFASRFLTTDIGVIVTDSHSTPLRRGAVGVAIGWWGIKPTESHVGKPDLFGREFKVEVTNIVDAIAAGATLAMGETSECTPLVIVRGTPGLTFVEVSTKDELFVAPKDDTFRVLYEDFLT